MPPEITLDDYRWLIDGPGRRWLEEPVDNSIPLHQLTARLRRDLSLPQTHLVIEQRRLRKRAEKKFPSADRLFFTQLALEQSSDWLTAGYKAERFSKGERVADLCCGIGGDLFRIAARGATEGFDWDQTACYLAAANAHELQLADCRVQQADVTKINLSGFGAIHIDPDRRATGRRSVKLENHEPSREFLGRLVEQSQHVAIKLAPATDSEDSVLDAAELEWLGTRRDCRQLVAWFGRLSRHPGKRVATVIGANEASTFVGEFMHGEISSKIDSYVIEPHPPVLAAKLAGQLSDEHGLKFVTAGGGYLTGTKAVHSPFCSNYEVIDTMAYRPKRIRMALRHLKVGLLVVKKRGVAVDPRQVQRDCQPDAGEQSAVLFLTSIQERVTAIIARRIDLNETQVNQIHEQA